MTTEESMDSLDRAVEESKRDLYMEFMVSHNRGAGCVDFDDRLDALIEAVSAKARAEERERLVTAMVMAGRLVDEASLVIETALLPTDEPARSSEEAEVCLHPRVSRMAAVGGPIICGVCGEEAGG